MTSIHLRGRGALIATALSALALAGLARPARAVTITVTYSDAVGYGFNDTTPYTSAPYSVANPTTLGNARKAVLEAVLSNWGQRLGGSVPIAITAKFNALGGSPTTGAVVASAGASYILRDFPGAAYSNTWYNAALGAELYGADPNAPNAMLNITINSDIDKAVIGTGYVFYYGFDGHPADFRNIDLYYALVHEMGHGLGFQSRLEAVQSPAGSGTYVPTGNYYADGSGNRYPGVFDKLTENAAYPAGVPMETLTAAARKTLVLGGGIYVNGPHIRALNNNASGRLYTPTTFQAGSSVSHLDETTYAGNTSSSGVNELMTPYVGPGVSHYPGPITTGLFQDMGWTFAPYTMTDAKAALKMAAGLQPTAEKDMSRENVTQWTTFPGRLDMLDALEILRQVAGIDPNPSPR